MGRWMLIGPISSMQRQVPRAVILWVPRPYLATPTGRQAACGSVMLLSGACCRRAVHAGRPGPAQRARPRPSLADAPPATTRSGAAPRLEASTSPHKTSSTPSPNGYLSLRRLPGGPGQASLGTSPPLRPPRGPEVNLAPFQSQPVTGEPCSASAGGMANHRHTGRGARQRVESRDF